MYKQIIFIIALLVNQLINAQENVNNLPVYNKSERIGFLYMDTTLKDCDGCYVLDKIKVFNKFIVVKSEARIIGIEGKSQFEKLYTVEHIQKGKNFIITFNNTMNSTSNKLYIKKISGQLIIFKQFSYSNSSVSIKKGKNDYSNYPSSFICSQNISKKMVKDTLDFKDLFKYKQNKECFHCPNKYSLEKCLIMKNNKQKFKWD
ncbi:hypothetical protein [uncultured Flavobacterium sp.]|uniref:hypothetical protein n=1 Tax=uncultured Flavobacterium sp. TaxID=165435 RepID=UPI00292DAD41|nr:hypothetical protein [uncultured Flavobacterium sp.]